MIGRRMFIGGFVAGAIVMALVAGYIALLVNRLNDSLVDTTQLSQTSSLKNYSFEAIAAATPGADTVFTSWVKADFWNNQQAAGWRRSVAGFESGAALEVVLTDAPAKGYHLGVQQNCGQFPPNTWLTISADINVPNVLSGSGVVRVELVLYPPTTDVTHVSAQLEKSETTHGWQRLSGSVRVPSEASLYNCVGVVHLVARQPLAHVSHVADFDNVVISTNE